MRSGRAAIAVVLAALCWTGCSSADDAAPTSSPPPPPTTEPASTRVAPAGAGQAASAKSDEGSLTGAALAEPAIVEEPLRCAPAPPDGPRTVTVWQRLGGDEAPAYLAGQVAAFTAAHPDVHVELVHPSGPADEVIRAAAALPDDERPDLVLLPPGAGRFAHDSGVFLKPADCAGGARPEPLSVLLPAVAAAFSVEGEMWAAPFGVSVPLLMYDRLRWERAGLDPDDPPETFDEMFATIDALVDSGEVVTGIALYDRAASWLISEIAARDGHLLVEPDNGHGTVHIESVEFELPGIADLLGRLHQLKADGRLAWLKDNQGDIDDLLALVHPEAPSGMTFHTSAALGDIYVMLAAAGFTAEVGAAPLPGGSTRGAALGGGGWALVDRGDPDQAAAAWQLVEWLVQPDAIGGLAAATGYVPTSEAAAGSAAFVAAAAQRPALATAYEVAKASRADTAASLQVGPSAEFQRVLELAVAYPIDVGDDPTTSLRAREAEALEWLRAYAPQNPDG